MNSFYFNVSSGTITTIVNKYLRKFFNRTKNKINKTRTANREHIKKKWKEEVIIYLCVYFCVCNIFVWLRNVGWVINLHVKRQLYRTQTYFDRKDSHCISTQSYVRIHTTTHVFSHTHTQKKQKDTLTF